LFKDYQNDSKGGYNLANDKSSPETNNGELIRLLMEMGMSRKTATTLTYLAQVDETVSKEIEENTNLSQPEVSTAIKELSKKGWIAQRKLEQNESKGRPVSAYKMTIPFSKAVNIVIHNKNNEIEQLQAWISKLKNLADTE
jgi:predicted transcriptional regulator